MKVIIVIIEPTPPLRVIARQMSGRRVQVQWDPPAEIRGVLVGYTVMVEPPLPPISLNVPATSTSAFIQEGHFTPGNKYTFWVIINSVIRIITHLRVYITFELFYR